MAKITDAELTEIKALREMLVEIVTLVGELHLNAFQAKIQLLTIEDEIKAQEDRFVEFQNKERVLFEQLQTTYGSGRIDMDTGEITE